MSAFLNFNGNQGTTYKSLGTGGGTSFTLDVPASTNSVLLTVGGVLQEPATDYTVSGVTVTTTSSVTSGVEVQAWVIHKPGTAPTIQDASVSAAKLDANAVTVGKISATGTASSSTFLRGDMAWAEAGGGGWEYVSNASVSGATAEFDNMVAGYDYEYVMEDVVVGTDSTALLMRLGPDTSNFRTSSYLSTEITINNAGTSQSYTDTGNIRLIEVGEGMGTGTDEAVRRYEIHLQNPMDSGSKTAVLARGVLYGASPQNVILAAGGFYNSNEAHAAVQWRPSSGTFSSGKIMQYRRARS